jgi:hypothetical protein
MKQEEKMSAEELLDSRFLKEPIDWETYQHLIAEYPEMEEELLAVTRHPD